MSVPSSDIWERIPSALIATALSLHIFVGSGRGRRPKHGMKLGEKPYMEILEGARFSVNEERVRKQVPAHLGRKFPGVVWRTEVGEFHVDAQGKLLDSENTELTVEETVEVVDGFEQLKTTVSRGDEILIEDFVENLYIEVRFPHRRSFVAFDGRYGTVEVTPATDKFEPVEGKPYDLLLFKRLVRVAKFKHREDVTALPLNGQSLDAEEYNPEVDKKGMLWQGRFFPTYRKQKSKDIVWMSVTSSGKFVYPADNLPLREDEFGRIVSGRLFERTKHHEFYIERVGLSKDAAIEQAAVHETAVSQYDAEAAELKPGQFRYMNMKLEITRILEPYGVDPASVTLATISKIRHKVLGPLHPDTHPDIMALQEVTNRRGRRRNDRVTNHVQTVFNKVNLALAQLGADLKNAAEDEEQAAAGAEDVPVDENRLEAEKIAAEEVAKANAEAAAAAAAGKERTTKAKKRPIVEQPTTTEAPAEETVVETEAPEEEAPADDEAEDAPSDDASEPEEVPEPPASEGNEASA